MDQSEEHMHDFELLLKKQTTKKPLGLYAGREKQDSLLNNPKTAQITYRARDVLESVSKQIQAIQNADTVSCRPVSSKLYKFKRKGFLPVNMIPVDEEVPTMNPNNFDTQFVSNTQLINVIEDAEIIDKHRGVTQEFDKTFCQKSDDTDDGDDKISENYKIDKNLQDQQENCVVEANVNNMKATQGSEKTRDICFDDINVTSEMDTLTCLPNDDTDDVTLLSKDHSNEIDKSQPSVDVHKVIDVNDEIQDVEIPASLVLNTRKAVSPPMVFSLYTFENFQNLALPIIEEYSDFETAKNMINSQIIGKELFIPNHIYTNYDRQSPVFSEVECINIDTGENRNVNSNLNVENITNSPESLDGKNTELGHGQSNNSLKTDFKDELLFSSDEEDDYVHKNIQELPLTCALDTSFFNKSDILDKTMYVGFQTASNKSIQINTDSFCKAKSILSDIDSDKTSLKELVDIFDTEKPKYSNFDNSYCTGEKGEYSNKNESFHKNKCTLDYMSESKMLSSEEMSDTLKNICLTALEQNVERKDDIVMSQVIEFKSVSTPRFNGKNDALKNNKKRKLEAIKTASNKLIKLSDNALAQCMKVFQDIDLKEHVEPIPCDGLSSHETTIKIENEALSLNLSQDIFEISDDSDSENTIQKPKSNKENNVISQINDLVILQEFEDNDMNCEETNNNCFMGFKTASDKDILITEGSLVKSKHVFHDILTTGEDCVSEAANNNSHTDQNDSTFKKSALGFKSMSKTKVKESIKPSASSRNEINCDFKQPVMFVGFKTAANNEINISKEALEKTKNFYKDVDEEYGSSTLEINQETVKEGIKDELERERQMVEELAFDEEFFDDNLIEPKTPVKSVYMGFQTASKKVIPISEKALAKSKKLFEDITNSDKDEEVVNSENECSRIHNEPKHKDTNKFIEKCKDSTLTSVCSNINYRNDEMIIDSCEFENLPTEVPIFKGFQTASNNIVKISDEALARSKKVFQDLELTQISDAKATSVSAATDSKIQENMSNKYDILNKTSDINNQNVMEVHKGLPDFVGFKTATLKPVKYSAESLAKNSRMLKEFELKDIGNMVDNVGYIAQQTSDEFVGFKTASNKNINVSAEALAKSKHMFNELDHVDVMVENYDAVLKPETGTFYGFKTASNKNIQISTDALAKSKQLFIDFELKEDNNMVENNNVSNNQASSKFVGFQTASNKTVQISEDALVKSKRMLSDFEFKDQNTSNNKFVGFHTASNKEVKISNDALAESKKVFDKCEIETTEQEEETCPVFKGFQTASNKKVVVSEKALINSKKMFQDLDIEHEKERNLSIEKDTDVKLFQGFQTASNNRVVISEKALLNSKNLFEDIDNSQVERNKVQVQAIINKEFHQCDSKIILSNFNEEHKSGDPKSFKGFQTASNKKVIISDEALAKTKVVFSDMHEPIIPENDSALKSATVNTIDNNDNVELDTVTNKNGGIIDTQIINDFQDSLNTEDFCKSTPKSKRSGSPILSCPRAKKRRFETPYNSKKKIEPKKSFIPPKLANTFKFKENYKKDKKYTLRDLEELNRDAKSEVDTYVPGFNFERLPNFEFFDARNDYTDGQIGVDQIKKIFLDAVNKKMVPDGWVDNHVQLIIWKLLSYEIKFPNSLKNVCTVRNVLEQLKYRYDKELFNVERPILRKILEKDDVPSKTMVLCVAGIYVDNVSVTSVPTNALNVELLLTDGWYTIRASIDRMFCQLVGRKAVVVGSKLATSGAELMGCEQGKAPWEDLSTVRLKLSANSTRRARWWTPLGCSRGVVRARLRGAEGGGRATVVGMVARVYPPLYAEKREGGTVTLSERLEHIRQVRFETERQNIVEKIYEELERELADEESQDSDGLSNENTNCLESGSQISKLMKKCRDPEEYRAHLTTSQQQLLEEHNSRRREKRIEEIRVKFQQKLAQTGVNTERNVVPLLKVRIADIREKCGVEIITGYLSIWKPSAAVIELVKEGAWIEILNVLPTGMRNSEIQLSAGRQTIFRPYKLKHDKFKPHTDIIQRKCYKIKELADNPSITTYFNEVDTTGIIFHIEPSSKDFDEKKNNFQNVFLADADKNMICVNFWGGIKKFGFEYVIDTGQIVTCVNLQKRAGNTRKSIPQYRVTEFTCFTKTPKDKLASEITKELTEKLAKIKEKFCEDCVALKDNYTVFKTRNNENVSPYRLDKSVSPLRCDANLNLTGLDFESSFKDTEISPMALLRKKQVKEKIQKLKIYGEPPPLSSIHIINKSKNASASYKSPLLSKPRVASTENQHLNNVSNTENEMRLQNVTSPNSLNRTYVKKINPVKLNFSNSVASENDLNDSVDHFAEEFESSPPLSLDSDVLL